VSLPELGLFGGCSVKREREIEREIEREAEAEKIATHTGRHRRSAAMAAARGEAVKVHVATRHPRRARNRSRVLRVGVFF
jgi:hypothetical protein